jgi:L-ascorbate metabolism protein UlaG (beta-lactamase superfamily)
LLIPEANRKFVCDRLHIEDTSPIGLDAGNTIRIGNISITAVPAAHNTIEKDENGQCKFLGYIFKLGNWCIYHSGDTLLYDGMSDLLKSHKPDIAILPINGNDPKRKVAGNLNSDDAVELAKSVGASIIIPCHYDLFEFNTADINYFIKAAIQKNQDYCVLDLGGKFSSSEL